MDYRQHEAFVPFLLALSLLLLPLNWVAAILLSMLVHELGHYIALRICDIKPKRISVGITGARMEIGNLTPGQECFCAFAGPLAGVSLVLLARWLPRTAICAGIHSVYNMLPVYPLDGGRVLRCTGLSDRVCDGVEQICVAVIFLLGLYGFVGLRLGITPLLLALLTIYRALSGKRLAKRCVFR